MAIKFVEEKGLLYELNDKGERVLVRSTESSSRAFLRFTNKTSRPVDIWWRDFRGCRHHYVYLEPRTHYDINSFVTHPWEFTDAATKERFVINNSEIYRAPPNLGGMMFRTNWNITVKVRSLRQIALLSLAEHIKNPFKVQHLGLPKVLEMELERKVMKMHGYNLDRGEEGFWEMPVVEFTPRNKSHGKKWNYFFFLQNGGYQTSG